MTPYDDDVPLDGTRSTGRAEAAAIAVCVVGTVLLSRHGAGPLTVTAALALVSALAQSGLHRHAAGNAGARGSARERRLCDALWRVTPLLFAAFPIALLFGGARPSATHIGDAPRVDLWLGGSAYLIALLELFDVAGWRIHAWGAAPSVGTRNRKNPPNKEEP